MSEKKKTAKEKKQKKLHAVEVLGSVREVQPEVDMLDQIHSYYK